MRRSTTVRIACPFGTDCPNRLEVVVSPYFRTAGNDPPEGPFLEHVSGCFHVAGEYDDAAIWWTLNEMEDFTP